MWRASCVSNSLMFASLPWHHSITSSTNAWTFRPPWFPSNSCNKLSIKTSNRVGFNADPWGSPMYNLKCATKSIIWTWLNLSLAKESTQLFKLASIPIRSSLCSKAQDQTKTYVFVISKLVTTYSLCLFLDTCKSATKLCNAKDVLLFPLNPICLLLKHLLASNVFIILLLIAVSILLMQVGKKLIGLYLVGDDEGTTDLGIKMTTAS